MVSNENHIGKITTSEKYLRELIMHAVTGCFGVADICSSNAVLPDFIPFKHRDKKSGVQIHADSDGGLIIDLHIKVTYGTNISAAVKSITHKVCFTIEEAAGMTVSCVNVYIDGIIY